MTGSLSHPDNRDPFPGLPLPFMSPTVGKQFIHEALCSDHKRAFITEKITFQQASMLTSCSIPI